MQYYQYRPSLFDITNKHFDFIRFTVAFRMALVHPVSYTWSSLENLSSPMVMGSMSDVAYTFNANSRPKRLFYTNIKIF